ncbi:MAG: Ig-like domain-containing protein, partial [Planctomycetota bacterium]
ADNTVTTNEDTAYTFSAADFGFSDVDAGDSLTKIQITGLESNGTLKLSGADVTLNQEILAADIGNLVFMPAQDANGTGYDSFDFKVHDGIEYSVAANTITVDVTPVQDAPTAADKTVTTNEDTAYTFSAADFGFSDVDAGDSLTKIQITGLESNGTLKLSGVDVTLNQEILVADIGNLVFMPAQDANGTGYDSFDFKVHDGIEYSVAANTITVDVTAVQDAPTAADNTVTTDEDMAYTFSAADFGFSDVDAGDSLTKIQITGLESNGTLKLSGADVTLNQEILVADIGNLVFMPAQDANGTGYDSFDFKVHDGIEYSVAANTITVDVTPVQDAPTAADKTVTTNEDTAYTFSAADFNFADVDAGDVLTQIQISRLESAGTLKLNGADVALDQIITVADINAGRLTFSPVPDANGIGYDSFDFKVHDGTEFSSLAYTMLVDVTAVQDAPTATNNTVTTSEDTAYTFSASDFNFTDVDGETLTQVQITALESNGSLQLNGVDVTLNQAIAKADIDAGNLRFVPAPDATGAAYDSFQFKVHDGIEYSVAPYSMTVDVTPVQDAPTAADKTVTVDEDTPYVFTSGDFNFADVDAGDSLTHVQIAALPSAGSLQLNGVDVVMGQQIMVADIDAGGLLFMPAADAHGAGYDSFRFKVHDGTNLSVADYAMAVDVTSVNDAPDITIADPGRLNPGATVSLSASATDVEGQSLTYFWTQIEGPTAELSGVNSSSPTLDVPFNAAGGELVFQLQVSDGAATSTEQITVQVNALPADPDEDAKADADTETAAVADDAEPPIDPIDELILADTTDSGLQLFEIASNSTAMPDRGQLESLGAALEDIGLGAATEGEPKPAAVQAAEDYDHRRRIENGVEEAFGGDDDKKRREEVSEPRAKTGDDDEDQQEQEQRYQREDDEGRKRGIGAKVWAAMLTFFRAGPGITQGKD